MLKRTRNVQKILERFPVIANVDTENVAFDMNNEDVVLVRGGMDFASHIGKTVWNYQDKEEEDA